MRQESEQAAAIVRERMGVQGPGACVDVGVVLGSGLAAIADQIASPVVVPYAELPGFPQPTQQEHGSDIVIGVIGTARVAIFRGRSHYYETGDIATMQVPLETLKLLGATAVVLTNAAGSVRQEIRPGSLIAIRDHINLTGINPLVGNCVQDRRFVDMSTAYDPVLRERFAVAVTEAGRKSSEGTYMWFPGPSFETPAEINAARLLGADLVGMSTVPEVIIARHLGLRVLAVSMVTNYATGLTQEPLARDQTLRAAAASLVPLTRVLKNFFDIWVLTGRTSATRTPVNA